MWQTQRWIRCVSVQAAAPNTRSSWPPPPSFNPPMCGPPGPLHDAAPVDLSLAAPTRTALSALNALLETRVLGEDVCVP
jgi:hypothetical protein